MKNVFLVNLLFTCFVSSAQDQAETPYVILVSFDGFRYDYAEREQLPHFLEMMEKGTSAASMIPSYPSKTFPNHYTLVTGLYPGNHGLVDNTFYDSARDATYAIRKREMVEDPFYYGGLPLWQLAQNNGLKSASFFWVGSEAPVAGRHPDYFKYYDDSFPDRERIRAVAEWLELPEDERPHFISLYFSVVDHVTHDFGPESPETTKTLHYADSLLGDLMDAVAATGLPVNIIVVSDHGMYPMKRDPARQLHLKEMMTLPSEGLRIVNNETHIHLYCNDSLKNRLISELKENENNYSAYLREDTPETWHYRDHYRIGDIVIEAAPGYSFRDPMRHPHDYGSHGYDPYTTQQMHAIFYAMGPAIRQNNQVPSFRNIHVYPLIARILGLPVSNIDGSVSVLEGILKDELN